MVGAPQGTYVEKGAPSCGRRAAEIPRLRAKFKDHLQIEFSECPSGDSFLEGMVLARNKIVHNGAMANNPRSGPRRSVTKILLLGFPITLTIPGLPLRRSCSRPTQNGLWSLSNGWAINSTHP